MKKLILVGSTAALIAGAGAAQAETKAFIEKAALEIIRTCEVEHGPDKGDANPHGFCISTESLHFKACWDKYPKEYEKRMRECTDPIQERTQDKRWEIMYNSATHIAEIKADPERIKKDEEYFYDDRRLLEGAVIAVNGKMVPMPITKENGDDMRREICATRAPKYGHPSQRLFDSCNSLFNKPTYPLDFTKQRKWQKEREAYLAKQKPQIDPHEACIDAKDYEGCVRVKSGANTSTRKNAQDICSPSGLCTVTTRGVDVFGLPKPMGWHYSQDEERISYFADPGRIPHKGQETRYLGLPRINRYYQNPEAGTSGSFIGGNTASTSCMNVGYSVNCTTTGTSPSYIPGTSATPGGIRSFKFTDVYDCQDNTYASYKNGKVWIGWKKADRERQKKGLIGVLKGRCERGDQYIKKEMKVLDLKL